MQINANNVDFTKCLHLPDRIEPAASEAVPKPARQTPVDAIRMMEEEFGREHTIWRFQVIKNGR